MLAAEGLECGSNRKGIRPEILFLDGDEAIEERLRLRSAALGPIQGCKLMERCADVGMVRSQCLFPDGERSLIERLGSARGSEQREPVECDRKIKVVRA